MRLIPPQVETLWTLFTAPLIWGLHFLACYVALAIYCAKSELADVSPAVLVWSLAGLTAVCLLLIVLSAWLAWRQWGFGIHDPPHDQPTTQSRTLSQSYATLLLAGLSFVAVVYDALPLLFISGCRS